MNDHETARDGISIWTNEQAAREIYLQAFEYPIVEGGAWDCNDATKWTNSLRNYANDPAVATAVHAAAKRILYTVANSNAMNGVSVNMQIVEVTPWWKIAIIAADVVFGLLAAFSIFMLVREIRNRKK